MFVGLESFDFVSDSDDEANYKAVGKQVNIGELNNDFAVPQKKRPTLSLAEESQHISKKPSVEKATLSPSPASAPNKSANTVVMATNEPRKLQFAKIDFKAPDKHKPRTSGTSSPSPQRAPTTNTPTPSSASAAVAAVQQPILPDNPPHKVARVSPTHLTSLTSDASTSSVSASTTINTTAALAPARMVSFDSSLAFHSSVNILAECSQAQNRVLAIQKGVDDMTVMYRDTIRGRLIRDREELALLGIR